MRNTTYASLLAFLFLPLAGCGEAAPRIAEAEGVVLINNKPAEDIAVEFAPDPAKDTRGPVSSAITDSNGRFRLKTHKGQDGAVVGWHRVALSDTKARQATQEQLAAGKQGSSRIPDRYSVASSSDIHKEVKEGKNDIQIAVTVP